MRPNFAFILLAFLAMGYTAQGQKEITNELIWYSGTFSADGVYGIRSMNDGIHYTTMTREGNIEKFDYAKGKKVATIVASQEIWKDGQKSIEGYEFSADEQQILISTSVEGIYRHSSKAFYYIYDLKSKRASALSDEAKGKQRLATFSPDGKKVAFVRDNNIFIYALDSKKETQVTQDGEFNKIINGATDWVYEEEFGFDKGIYWSPNSDRLAYYRFDEGGVKEFQMEYYGALYPDIYKFKYPKAGEDNSKVNIFIYDLANQKAIPVDIGLEKDIYIPRIKWSTSNDGLCVMRLNRHQNHLEFLLTDYANKKPFNIPTQKIYDETSETYVEINDNLIFLEDGKNFIWNSPKDGYNHIYLNGIDGKKSRPLTSGNWDVIELYGVDQKEGMFYFSSSQESVLEKHVYQKGIYKRSFNKLTPRKGSNRPSFSKTFRYMINFHSDANTPAYISLIDTDKNKEVRVLKDNERLKRTLEEYNTQPKEFFTFTNSAGVDLNCWMIKPPNFDPNKEYPVYVNIYGGPGHNTVADQWEGAGYMWHQLLAQKGYIVASCDPRGTMYRGREFFHSTYMQLGKLETEDFIDFAKHLGSENYIDKERIGMQGWSYGGYMTSLCMTKGAEVYKAGISVAPVTNWRYYDSIYTERFMRTPQENEAGYDDNSPINHVDKLKGPFLLVHGSADDNVHMQNTMEMINELVKANKQFDLFIYPDRNHGIYGGTTRLNLYTKILNFVEENL